MANPGDEQEKNEGEAAFNELFHPSSGKNPGLEGAVH